MKSEKLPTFRFEDSHLERRNLSDGRLLEMVKEMIGKDWAGVVEVFGAGNAILGDMKRLRDLLDERIVDVQGVSVARRRIGLLIGRLFQRTPLEYDLEALHQLRQEVNGCYWSLLSAGGAAEGPDGRLVQRPMPVNRMPPDCYPPKFSDEILLDFAEEMIGMDWGQVVAFFDSSEIAPYREHLLFLLDQRLSHLHSRLAQKQNNPSIPSYRVPDPSKMENNLSGLEQLRQHVYNYCNLKY